MQFTAYHPQFFTATNLEWKPLLKETKYIDIIINSLRFLVTNNRVKIYSFVVMPNHLHLIWQVQPGHERKNVQQDFLKFTAQKIRFDMQLNHIEWLKEFEVNAKDRKYQFWERNPLSVDLYSEPVFLQKMDYIHNNLKQEKWNLCASPEEYHYSSALFYHTGIDNWGFLSHWLA
jgi:putative transposase